MVELLFHFLAIPIVIYLEIQLARGWFCRDQLYSCLVKLFLCFIFKPTYEFRTARLANWELFSIEQTRLFP